MKTLKEYITNGKKEEVYDYYKIIISKPKSYEQVTRSEMYDAIVALYKEDPEEILKLCMLEEIEILKMLLKGNTCINNGGYIEYIMYKNLRNHLLILDDEETDMQYIPIDIVNYVKMALNLYNEEVYSLKDVTDSVLVGLIRIHNSIKLIDLVTILPLYYVNMTMKTLKDYITNNPKLKDKIKIIRYQKEEYVISLEYYFYKDIIKLQSKNYKYKEYTLESVISIGKYKMNLFKEELFKFLSFLEMHLHPKYIISVIEEIVIYCGFDMNSETTLKSIADNIDELYKEIASVTNYFPIWIYNGNDQDSLKENIILPDKNDPCICGSGKKFKNCCRKFYK